MTDINLIAFVAGVAGFLLLVALANVIGWPDVRPSVKLQRPHRRAVSVLIPARDEEANLPACLDAVLRQGEIVGEVLIYDDHSTDATAQVIARYAQRDARVRAVAPVPLAPGWCGKNFACDQLAQHATGALLLFLDADARFVADDAIARMAAELERRQLTLLSCWPGLEMTSFWERALMPLLNFVVFSIFPAPLSLYFNFPSLALAHGACLLFERESYFRLGGHSTVRDQIFEDTRLAQLWRSRNERALCLDGQAVVRVRMYASFGDIWRGFQKNFFPAFRRASSFWGFLGFHLLVFLVPFGGLVVRPSRWAAWAVVAVLAIRLMLALRFRHPLISVLLHPLGETLLLALGLSSWWRCRSGRGVTWKGRDYAR